MNIIFNYLKIVVVSKADLNINILKFNIKFLKNKLGFQSLWNG